MSIMNVNIKIPFKYTALFVGKNMHLRHLAVANEIHSTLSSKVSSPSGSRRNTSTLRSL